MEMSTGVSLLRTAQSLLTGRTIYGHEIKPAATSANVCSKAVILLLFTYCLLLLQLFAGDGFTPVVLCSSLCFSSFAIVSLRKKGELVALLKL